MSSSSDRRCTNADDRQGVLTIDPNVVTDTRLGQPLDGGGGGGRVMGAVCTLVALCFTAQNRVSSESRRFTKRFKFKPISSEIGFCQFYIYFFFFSFQLRDTEFSGFLGAVAYIDESK